MDNYVDNLAGKKLTTIKHHFSQQDPGPYNIQKIILFLATYDDPGIVNILHNDHPLQKLIGIWPILDLTGPSPDPIQVPQDATYIEARDALWSAFNFDHGQFVSQVRRHLGQTFPANPVLDRAIANILVFPDGSVHPMARRYMEAKTAYIIKMMTPDDPTASDDSKGVPPGEAESDGEKSTQSSSTAGPKADGKARREDRPAGDGG